MAADKPNGRLFDVYDRGDAIYEPIGRARTSEEACTVALKRATARGYPDPQVYACKLIPRVGFEVELTYANLDDND